MTLWIRIVIVLSMIAASYGLGTYVKGKFERAAQADALEEQITGLNKQIKEQDTRAKETEDKLQAERQNNAELNRKWSKIRANKDRGMCPLDPDTIRLLKSAGTGSPDAR